MKLFALCSVGLSIAAMVAIGPTPVMAQPAPQFKAGTDITRLEVTVLDSKTRLPVRGLTAEDFTIKVGGREQPIVALSEVAHPGAGGSGRAFAEVAHDVTSNERRPDRLFAIVLDDAAATNDPFERRMGLQIANRIVDQMDPETDLAAVIFTRNNRHAQDFTRDRTLLRQAIARFNPVPLGATRVLDRTLQFMQGVPGYRRAIFFISAGQAGVAAASVRSALQNSLSAVEGERPLGAEVTLGTVGAVGASHVPVYMFSTVGLRAPTAADLTSGRLSSIFDGGTADAFRATARATGGRAVVDNNLPVQEVPAIFGEMSSYYVIGFRHDYPTDGALRWLQVDVGRQGVLVMPSDLPMATPDTRLEGASAAPTTNRWSGLMEILEAPVSDGVLPLRLAISPFRSGTAEAEAVLTLGLPQVAGGQGQFQFSVLVFDGEGRRQLQRVDREVSVRSGGATELVLPLKLRPERYAVRIAVQEVGGAAGAVHATVVVPDFARIPVSLSGVAIGRAESGAIGGREAISHLLSFAPTTARTFTATDQVGALVRLYRAGDGRDKAAALTTEILNDAGTVVYRSEVTYPPAAGGEVEHRLDMPLRALGAGDYVLRFVAGIGSAKAQRDVRFRVTNTR